MLRAEKCQKLLQAHFHVRRKNMSMDKHRYEKTKSSSKGKTRREQEMNKPERI
jgi:hypothetical protein